MTDFVLLQITKNSILSKFDTKYNINKKHLSAEYPFLNKKGAVFITLHHNNQLRGCIGSIIAHRSLLEDVIHNAHCAAFEDPRFQPLSNDELTNLKLEVSILSEPEILEYDDFDDLVRKIRPNIDGLILKHGIFQGTFLPQVWEQLLSPKNFLEHLSMKAGSNPSIYDQHPSIYRYKVRAIKENFNEILPL